jgi:hypothetical protein
MPNFRVTCPACSTTLELDAQHAGQEVECGSCLQVFVATPPPPPPPPRPVIRGVAPTKPAPSRPPTRRTPRRPSPRDDDDYPHDRYDDDYADPPVASGLGTASLVLGILSVVAFCCWPLSGLLGVLAIILGAVGRGNPPDRGSATAGLILGIVGLVLTAAFVLVIRGDWDLPFPR